MEETIKVPWDIDLGCDSTRAVVLLWDLLLNWGLKFIQCFFKHNYLVFK